MVYATAGGTGVGAYQAAKDGGKLAIGVYLNHNYRHPDTMLPSMLKRIYVATYNVFKSTQDGSFKLGIKFWGVGKRGWMGAGRTQYQAGFS